jgi:hypothetical protein
LQYLEFQFSTTVLKAVDQFRLALIIPLQEVYSPSSPWKYGREKRKILVCTLAIYCGREQANQRREKEHTLVASASAAAAKSKHRDNDDVLQRPLEEKHQEDALL